MNIVVDVGQTAERLDALIDPAFLADEVFVCQGERPVAQPTAVSQNDALASDRTESPLVGRGPAAQSSTQVASQKQFLIDAAWTLAADGCRAAVLGTTSAHDAHHDAAGLPK